MKNLQKKQLDSWRQNKLKNFQNEGTTASGKEVIVEIVGIFNGKLSEQSTGLTSDLTENRIYMDYKRGKH